MKPIAEYSAMDRQRFSEEIVPKGEPAVLRGLMADWPAVQAAKRLKSRRLCSTRARRP
jgi:hypothetical protein